VNAVRHGFFYSTRSIYAAKVSKKALKAYREDHARRLDELQADNTLVYDNGDPDDLCAATVHPHELSLRRGHCIDRISGTIEVVVLGDAREVPKIAIGPREAQRISDERAKKKNDTYWEKRSLRPAWRAPKHHPLGRDVVEVGRRVPDLPRPSWERFRTEHEERLRLAASWNADGKRT